MTPLNRIYVHLLNYFVTGGSTHLIIGKHLYFSYVLIEIYMTCKLQKVISPQNWEI